MSQYNCTKCDQPTDKVKFITSKKDGRQYKLYECVQGCMSDNGRFAFSFFPPKEKGTKYQGGDTPPVVAKDTETVFQLKRIADALEKLVLAKTDPLEKAMQ